MQVFNLYVKLIKKNLPSILLYFGIFIAIVVLITLATKDTTVTDFEETKIKVAYINNDEENVLLEGFEGYLEDSAEFVYVGESEEELRDALFYRIVDYIIIVPEGFTDSLSSGSPMNIEKMIVPDSPSAAYMDMSIEQYFNTVEDYQKTTDLSMKEIVDKVLDDFAWSTKTTIHAEGREDMAILSLYFNYSSYAITSVLILAVGVTMLSVGNIHIRRRNAISPIPMGKRQFQQVLSYLGFTLLLDLVIIVIGLFFKGNADLTTYVLFSLNVLVLSIAILCLAYFVSIGIKSREALNGMANVFSLGFAFLGGVFIPAEFLGDTAIKIGKFTPTYWFTTANNAIYQATSLTEDLSNIFTKMAIQLGFGVVFFVLALIANKKKQTATE